MLCFGFCFLTLCITLWGEATQCISRAEELKVIEWWKVAMYLQYWMQKYHVIWFLGASARALSGTLLIFKTIYIFQRSSCVIWWFHVIANCITTVLHISLLVYSLWQRISQAADACQSSDQVQWHSLDYTGWWMTYLSASVSADALFLGWETMSEVHSGTYESPKLLGSQEVAAKCSVEMDISLETWLYPCKMHLPCLAQARVLILLEISSWILPRRTDI